MKTVVTFTVEQSKKANKVEPNIHQNDLDNTYLRRNSLALLVVTLSGIGCEDNQLAAVLFNQLWPGQGKNAILVVFLEKSGILITEEIIEDVAIWNLFLLDAVDFNLFCYSSARNG